MTKATRLSAFAAVAANSMQISETKTVKWHIGNLQKNRSGLDRGVSRQYRHQQFAAGYTKKPHFVSEKLCCRPVLPVHPRCIGPTRRSGAVRDPNHTELQSPTFRRVADGPGQAPARAGTGAGAFRFNRLPARIRVAPSTVNK